MPRTDWFRGFDAELALLSDGATKAEVFLLEAG